MVENEFVNGILDNDLYKFTMQNAVCINFPNAIVSHDFINRDGREFPSGFANELGRIVNTFRGFKLSKEGKEFLRLKRPELPDAYLDYLSGYQFDPNEVHIRQVDSALGVHIRGPWRKNILWEPPLMATISQLYFQFTRDKYPRDKRQQVNKEKAIALRELGARCVEFGTRRRESLQNHQEVIRDLKEHMKDCLLGTSNVQLALDNDLTPFGTYAHEWPMFHAAKYGFKMANRKSLETWVKTYNGRLGVALPDTFTSDIFFQDFDDLYARIFDGLRQDSGDPVGFMHKAVQRYKELNIDPASKTIGFTNSIDNIELVKHIREACKNRIKDWFGIGTWMSNDVGVDPLNIVIKMAACLINDRWVPTIKLSDDKGKNTGDEKMVKLCKDTLEID